MSKNAIAISCDLTRPLGDLVQIFRSQNEKFSLIEILLKIINRMSSDKLLS
jgi:hypothetical protein